MIEFENRSEIPEFCTWDLSDIFANDEDFEKALEEAQRLPMLYKSFEGKISQSAKDLLECMQLDDKVTIELSKISNYASRKSDEDTRDSKYTGYSSQVQQLYVAIMGASSWFMTELMSIPEDRWTEFYSDCPELELYRTLFERILRKKEHILSPEGELLLSMAGEMSAAPAEIFSMLNDADLTFDDAIDSKGEPHTLTQGTYIPLMNSADRMLRKSAFESIYAGYENVRNTMAAIIRAQVKQLDFFAKARKYASPLEAALDQNEVPVEVYHKLIEAVHKGLPAMHRYIELRKKLLGVDELHFYDLYTPIVSEVDKTYTYEDACEIILEALKPMGSDYRAIVKKALSSRWIDVFENPGKRSGAYSAGGAGVHPYMLLNFHGTLDDVFTLIHEMGHSIHTYLSCENQATCYSDYVIFVAEVASTVNESLLIHYLLNHCENPKERAYLINHFLEQFRGTLYRQTMFAEFELEIADMNSKGIALTPDALDSTYLKLNQLYYGDKIVHDSQIAREWERIPHFYYRYYVYQYATGFAAAIALSQQILSRQPDALDNYIDFLSSGSSKDPISLLKGAGVDMSSTAAIEDALSLFEDLLDQIEKLEELQMKELT